MSGELLYGIHSVEAALNHDPQNVIELYFELDSQNARIKELSDKARELGLKPHARPRDALDRMTGGARHQGAVARYRAPPPRAESDLPTLIEQAGRDALLLILDGVTDPHNLGACLRNADAFGAHAVIVPKDRAVGVNATVAKAASGAADTVPVVTVTNLARAIAALKERGIWVLGADTGGESIVDADLGGPIAWVLGAEGQGLRRLTRESCDRIVGIPIGGTVESLNVSVATGICLYATRAARGRAAR
jgi:23S rRNA (guanosine2251-2'-O)-methyltransferase